MTDPRNTTVLMFSKGEVEYETPDVSVTLHTYFYTNGAGGAKTDTKDLLLASKEQCFPRWQVEKKRQDRKCLCRRQHPLTSQVTRLAKMKAKASNIHTQKTQMKSFDVNSDLSINYDETALNWSLDPD